MIHLLNALGSDIKPAGKDRWRVRCPVHGSQDGWSMIVSLRHNNSVGAHCFNCGANGLDLYQHLQLPLDELMGGVEQDRTDFVPAHIKDAYIEDKLVMAIYKSDFETGKVISYIDQRRHRLAVARVEGIKRKWPNI